MTTDLVIRNARVWSEGRHVPDVDAVAVHHGAIVAVGKAADLVTSARRIIDARNATVTPGLCDAHLHLVAWARTQDEVRLEGLRGRQETLDAVAAFASRHPERDPVVGRGWDADRWEEAPDRAALDSVAQGRAVLLHSKDFHSLWVNSIALARAGVGRHTQDPPGGRFERAASGEPSGIVREHGVRLFENQMPRPDGDLDRDRVRRAAAALLAEGVTAIHDFEGEREAELLRELTAHDGPRVRVLMHIPRVGLDEALAAGRRSGQGDDDFRWGALKLFADGTLGSRTAAVLDPYDDGTGSGMDLLSPAELGDLVGRAYRGGLSVAVHAIGDRAVRHVLDAFEAAPRPVPGLMPRIEHVQLLHDDDRARFSRLGVAASMQPTHCVSDLPHVEKAWRSRAARSYPWRSLIESGATLAFGSDAPVEAPSAAAGLHAAVTRRHHGSVEPFVPGECLTLDQALSAYTVAPARLSGSWPRLGRIAAGALADLVVWDGDLHEQPPDALATARPRWTLLEGRVMFDADAAPRRSDAAAMTRCAP